MSATDTHTPVHMNLLPTYTWAQMPAPHPHPSVTQVVLFQLDHCLQEASPHYKSLRFRGSVGPARVHLVDQGAFRALREALATCSLAPFPPEMPRVLRYRHLAQLLRKRVVS